MWRFICFVFGVFFVTSVYAEQRIFKLGVIAERPDHMDEAFNQYIPLHEYLTAKLAEKNITMAPLAVAHNVREMANWVQAGKIDAVIEGVFATRKINLLTNRLSPSLLAWRKGQREYRSVFFVRKDSDIESLEDLAGKEIAFESPRSTSAYFVPKAVLGNHGLSLMASEQAPTDMETLRFQFALSELNQAYWVHRGKTDAAAFNDGDWLRVPEKIRDDLRIIYRTKPIVRWLFSTHTHFDNDIKQTVERILEFAHTEHPGQRALDSASRITKFEKLSGEDLMNIDYWNSFFHN